MKKILIISMVLCFIATTIMAGSRKDYAVALKYYASDNSTIEYNRDYGMVQDEKGLRPWWNLKYKPAPTMTNLDAIMDEAMAPVEKKEKEDAEELVDMQATLRSSQSNILAVAQSIGVTNIPVSWKKIDKEIQKIAATNQLQGVYIGLLIQKDLLFYVLNGGNPRKIGAE